MAWNIISTKKYNQNKRYNLAEQVSITYQALVEHREHRNTTYLKIRNDNN
jgi:hypothetical protein